MGRGVSVPSRTLVEGGPGRQRSCRTMAAARGRGHRAVQRLKPGQSPRRANVAGRGVAGAGV
jgi:hypothetical protein